MHRHAASSCRHAHGNVVALRAHCMRHAYLAKFALSVHCSGDGAVLGLVYRVFLFWYLEITEAVFACDSDWLQRPKFCLESTPCPWQMDGALPHHVDYSTGSHPHPPPLVMAPSCLPPKRVEGTSPPPNFGEGADLQGGPKGEPLLGV